MTIFNCPILKNQNKDCPRTEHKQALVFQAKPGKLWDENDHDVEST